MGQQCTRNDFEWSATDEPHATRRKIILEKYPEVKKLFGYDPKFKFIVTGMVIVQFIMIFIMQNQSWPVIIVTSYCFGGILNHSLALAIHEIAHNLAFGHSRPLFNRLLGFFCNLPIGIPVSISFRKYHLQHHKYQGDDLLDADLPTEFEAKLFSTTFGKLCFIFLQPLVYGLRPLIVEPKPMEKLELINIIIQFSFDYLVYYFVGGKALSYLVIGTLLAMGCHPIAGHFISEHYMFSKGYETYSYYGPLNSLVFNVGYHNEHHDFPFIPGSRLPELKRIAAEFYDDIPQHNSWIKVLYDFITDPDVGVYSRIKRKSKLHTTNINNYNNNIVIDNKEIKIN